MSVCSLRFLKRNTRSLARAVVDRKRELPDVDDDHVAERVVL